MHEKSNIKNIGDNNVRLLYSNPQYITSKSYIVGHSISIRKPMCVFHPMAHTIKY